MSIAVEKDFDRTLLKPLRKLRIQGTYNKPSKALKAQSEIRQKAGQ